MSADSIAALRQRPIGVFDSGVGGLTVLRALRAELPQEHFVYVSDSGHAPYGEKTGAFVAGRCQAIAAQLLAEHGIKALVIACNTATAAGADGLRQAWPQMPVIGIEPALKPAAALTRTRRVGVLATRGTLQSTRFARLLAAQPLHVQFVAQPCDGLADAIEKEIARPAWERAGELIARYLAALGPLGHEPGAIDTLVLGCTHYPLAESLWQRHAGSEVALLEPGPPVARHTRRRLAAAHLLNEGTAAGQVHLLDTGDATALRAAACRLQLTDSAS